MKRVVVAPSSAAVVRGYWTLFAFATVVSVSSTAPAQGLGVITEEVTIGGESVEADSVVLSDTKVWRSNGCWEDVGGTLTAVTDVPVPEQTIPLIGEDSVLTATRLNGSGTPRLDGLLIEEGGCQETVELLNVQPGATGAAPGLKFAMTAVRRGVPAVVASGDALALVDLGAATPTLQPWLTADDVWRAALEAVADLPLEGRASGDEVAVGLSDVNAFHAPDGKLWIALVTTVDSDVSGARLGFNWVLRFDGDDMEVILSPEQMFGYTMVSIERGVTMRPMFDLGVVQIGRRAVPLTGTPQQIRERAMVIEPQIEAYTDGQGRRYVNEGGLIRRFGFDPAVADIDYDGLLYGEELAAGTSDGNFDSDFDGRPDAAELALGTDPTQPDPRSYAGPSALGLSSAIMDWSVLRVHEVTDEEVTAGIDSRYFWMNNAAPLPGGVCQFVDGAATGGWPMTCFELLGEQIGSFEFGRQPPSFDADGETIWVQPGPGTTYEPWSLETGQPTGAAALQSQTESGELVAGLNGLMRADASGTPRGIELFENTTSRWIENPAAVEAYPQFRFVGRDPHHGLDLFAHTSGNGLLFGFDGDKLVPLFGSQYLARNDDTNVVLETVDISAIRALPGGEGYVVFFFFDGGESADGATTLRPAYQFLDSNFAAATPGLVGHRVDVQQWVSEGWLAEYRYRRRVAVTFNGKVTCVSSTAGTVCDASETRELPINNPEVFTATYQQAVPTDAGLQPGDVLLAGAQHSLWKHSPSGATTMFMSRTQITRQLGGDPGLPMEPRAMSVAPDRREVCVVDENRRLLTLTLGDDFTPDRMSATAVVDATTCAYSASGQLHWVSTTGDLASDDGVVLNLNAGARTVQQVDDRWVVRLEDNTALCVRNGTIVSRLGNQTGVGVDNETNTVFATDTQGSVRAFTLDDYCTGELNRGELVFGTALSNQIWFNLYFFANRSIRPSDSVTVTNSDIATFGPGHLLVLPRDIATSSYAGTTPNLLFRLLPSYANASGPVVDALTAVNRGRDYFHRASELSFVAMAQAPGVGARPADYYDVDPSPTTDVEDEDDPSTEPDGDDSSNGDGCCATHGGGGPRTPLVLVFALALLRRRHRRAGSTT